MTVGNVLDSLRAHIQMGHATRDTPFVVTTNTVRKEIRWEPYSRGVTLDPDTEAYVFSVAISVGVHPKPERK
jgi:hypothetical protein